MSYYRHDFNYCACGKVYIDGGTDYTRIGGNREDFEMFQGDWEVDLSTGKKKCIRRIEDETPSIPNCE